MYGRKLNTLDVGVSCNGAGTFFFKKNEGILIKGRPLLLTIEDPQAPENYIGKSSFNYFQVRSAFAMAYSTLTNSRTIMSLCPARSILGTIIRHDAVLVERKGEVSFNNILRGAGERLDQHFGDQQQGLFCNWRLDEDEEHPLPRGDNNVTAEHGSGESSGKKRKRLSSSKKSLKMQKKMEKRGHPKKRKAGRKRGGYIIVKMAGMVDRHGSSSVLVNCVD